MINIDVNVSNWSILKTETLFVTKQMLPVNIVITDSDPGKINLIINVDKEKETSIKYEHIEEGTRIIIGNPGWGIGIANPIEIGTSEDGKIYFMMAVRESTTNVYKIDYNLYLERSK